MTRLVRSHLLLLAITNVTLASGWLSQHQHQHQYQHNRPASSRTRYPVRYAIAEQQLGSFESLLLDPTHRRVALENDLEYGHYQQYEKAWQRQKDLLQQHVDRIKQDSSTDSFLSDTHSNAGCDRILMLEHSPIYTLGTGSDERFILQGQSALNEGTQTIDTVANSLSPIPVIRMDRGGEVTYHGPGQLVVYPVLDLRHYRQDIHWYMRALEETVLVACRKLPLRHSATRQDDTTGIWIDNHKIAAMGIKCSRWITQHGLAVNVEQESLRGFGGIVPCGLEGRKVGCVNQFLDEPTSVREFAAVMQEALEQVFCIQLVDAVTFGD